MGFTIPNAISASIIDQAEPDSGDFVALGDRKSGVISGCAVTASTVNDQNVSVASGEVLSNGVYYTISSTTLSMGAGTAGAARFDLVVVNSSGVVTKRDGAAYGGTNPSFPPLSDGDVFLAAVYRAAGSTDVISSTRIIDKRVVSPSNTVRTGAGAPSSSLGSIGDIYVNTSVSSSTGQSQVYVKTTASLWENLAEYYAVATTNTANALVQRDSSGNFAAGTVTATAFSGPLTGAVTGNVTGNASTASAFNTSRTVALTGGDVTGTSSASDGNHTINAVIGAGKVTNTMLDYTNSVPQIFVNTGTTPTTSKDGDIWIVV